jgi:hypothetical protein
MPLEATGERGGLLDSTGRQILNLAEYRIIGIFIAAILLVFVLWRRGKFDAWPSVEDCVYVCTNVLAVLGSVFVGVAFLLTKPPAVELLSSQALLTIGIFVPIVSFGYAFPRLRTLFFPSTPPAPPPRDEQHPREGAPRA